MTDTPHPNNRHARGKGKPPLRLSRSAEDYLEAVGALCRECGCAHVSAIAEKLGVRKPSVTAAVQQLAQFGFVEYQPYSPVRLTEQGRKYANNVMNAHSILHRFFIQDAGLSPERADEVACQMEHLLTYEEIDAIAQRLAPEA